MRGSGHSDFHDEVSMLIDDFRNEYTRWRRTAEQAIAQMPDEALNHVPSPDGNSVAMLVRHVSGNLVSRFTNFLTEDGEKPDRDRDAEFEEHSYTRAEIDEMMRRGFGVVDATLASLTDDDVTRTVTVRGEPMTVHAALARSLAHIANHMGQIVLLAKITVGGPWRSLSIPRGQSKTFNSEMQSRGKR
jgi:uncharacterized damage-inducible protein DinB